MEKSLNPEDLFQNSKAIEEDLLKVLANSRAKTVTATAGGGMVTATINLEMQIVSLKIEKEVINPDDAEMLQDLVVSAVNEGLNQAQKLFTRELSEVTLKNFPRP
ncbi:MAG: YbaB/EbfC family nucleoid-associated protein [Deltaproteobacteria bacterium]|jgi:DNA-binding YbaB/EbfC family protein|nr:YbaB/EbfC family nucleoid-associated protein [Deltaproteobacteria bacterium]